MRHASLTAQITHPQDHRRTRTARLERKLERACSPADPLAADMPRYRLGAAFGTAFGVGARGSAALRALALPGKSESAALRELTLP